MVPNTKDDEQQDQQDQQEQQQDPTEQANQIVAGGPSLQAETTQADSNPAFYPKDAKSEALHGEAEKADLDYPGPIVEADEIGEMPVNSPQRAAVAAQHSDAEPQSGEDIQNASNDSGPGEVPARNASTAVWRQYATQGAPADNRYTEDEANAASRDEIADYYLGT